MRLRPCVSHSISVISGSNKRIRKIVGSLVELYPSFSAEISSVLLEFLLKALDSSKSHNQPGQDIRVFLDEWKPVILEFSNREPELLLTLLKAVLDMIQNNERRRYETGNYGLSPRNLDFNSRLFPGRF